MFYFKTEIHPKTRSFVYHRIRILQREIEVEQDTYSLWTSKDIYIYIYIYTHTYK